MHKWVKRYFRIAREISTWSKDPRTKIGAVVVGKDGQILSQGYNGFPRGVNDIKKRLEDREEKLRYVVHAEMNCIYNASLTGVSLKGAELYVFGLPVCSECAKGVVQVGISRVNMCYPVAIDDKWRDSAQLSQKIFNEAGVKTYAYKEADLD